MSPLAVRIGAGALVLLALFALRGKRWAYLAFVLLGLAYFPAQTHFHVHVPKCELLLPTMQQLVPLLHNYVYIALFAGFYWMSWVQFRDANARGVWALVATLLAGALVEIAQGVTAPVARAGTRAAARAAAAAGPCTVRDLVPYVAGAVGAALLLAIWSRLTRKPAYVRLVKRGAAPAPRRAAPAPPPLPPAPPPRTAVSPRVPPEPVSARGFPPPPQDFSPGSSPIPSVADTAPTEEVAPRKGLPGREEIIQRLRTILGRLGPMLQRGWMIIQERRRTVVIGGVVVLLVGAGALVILRLGAPAAVVTAQPDSAALAAAALPPPPPPPPLQSEAEGYYEPSYKFTVSERRFTRVTLRPQAFVTFTRPGTRQEVGCADARISPAAVHLRCEIENAGLVATIDGQFTLRTATSRLDAPVLNALVTMTNTRGEVLYSARQSFYWHEPD